MKKYRYLKGSNIILNLKRININARDSRSSSTCGGNVFFCFDDTKHGYVEDPDLSGTIRVLSTEKKKGCYILKVKFKKEKDDA